MRLRKPEAVGGRGMEEEEHSWNLAKSPRVSDQGTPPTNRERLHYSHKAPEGLSKTRLQRTYSSTIRKSSRRQFGRSSHSCDRESLARHRLWRTRLSAILPAPSRENEMSALAIKFIIFHKCANLDWKVRGESCWGSSSHSGSTCPEHAPLTTPSILFSFNGPSSHTILYTILWDSIGVKRKFGKRIPSPLKAHSFAPFDGKPTFWNSNFLLNMK